MMTVEEILAELCLLQKAFPHQAIADAVAQREAITPELLRILQEVGADLSEFAEGEDYMAHIFAMYLLAQFREPRAYPLIVNLVRGDQQLVDLILGDVITEALGPILASVCHGDLGPIKAIIEDPALDEYVRSAGLAALIVLVTEGALSRDEAMAYFGELYRSRLEREFNFVWSHLVSASCDLYPEEVLGDIEQAFADGLVDPFYVDMDSVKRALKRGRERSLERLPADLHNHFIGDTARELSWWACFHAVEPSPLVPRAPSTKPPLPQTPYYPSAAPKVRRNDSCPCGSGKKYKVCCMP